MWQVAWSCKAGAALVCSALAVHGSAQTPTIRVDSKLVQANCTATQHKSSVPVEISTTDDVTLFEDGKAVPLVGVRRAEDTPLLLFLLLDVSGSEASNWDVIREQTAVFLEKALRPGDRIAVITFDARVRLLIDVTDPKASVARLAERVRLMLRADGKEILPIEGGADGGTRLWDAISVAAQVSGKSHDRHAAIVFTDGGENGSAANAMTVLERSTKASMPIYEIENSTGVSSPNSRFYLQGPMAMRGIVEKSGGLVLSGDGRKQRVAADLERLAEMLRRQFLVEYKPPPGEPPRFHALKVKAVDRSVDIRCKAAVWH